MKVKLLRDTRVTIKAGEIVEVSPSVAKFLIGLKSAEIAEEEKPKKKLRTMREKAEHIRKYCIFRSFRQLREETGLTTAEIRRIYDRLHEVHGI